MTQKHNAAFSMLMLLSLCTAANAKQTPQRPPQPAAAPPVVVEVHAPQKTPEDRAQEQQDRDARQANEEATLAINRKLMWIGGFQLFVFVLQLGAFVYQGVKLRQTVSAADSQSRDMRASIEQSARAATALETLGTSVGASADAAAESVATLKERTALQMRAYLTVIVSTATYQERDKANKFGAQPLVVNAGNTPARNVRQALKAAIMQIPIPPNTELPPVGDLPAGAMLGPHQSSTLAAFVEDFVPDQDVDAIKRGTPRGLAVWGRVAYEDIFGEEHITEFCHTVLWLPNGNPHGFYTPGRNRAT